MFTGIIQEIGQVLKVEADEGKLITVSCQKTLNQLNGGDSISINGACQTATATTSNSFSFYSSTETLSLTNLNHLRHGNYVNLERPLSLNSLLDGHLVQGHVDNTGVIQAIQKKGGEFTIRIGCPKNLLSYMIQKGSIAIDGVSLTINELYGDRFSLTIIPITFEKTIFQYRKVGDIVNIEVDFFAKYVEKFVTGKGSQGNITRDFLSEHGF